MMIMMFMMIMMIMMLYTVLFFNRVVHHRISSHGTDAAGRALQGISASSSVAISAMLSAAYTDRREMLRAANLVSCIALVGHIAGPAAGGFLASAFGWRFGFLAVFCLAALITLANYLLLPDLTTEKAPEAPTATEGGNGRILWRQLLVLMGLSLLRGSSYAARCCCW